MKKLFLICLMLQAGSAWAEWVFVAESNGGFIWIDPATIRKDGSMRRFWILTNFKKPLKDGSLSSQDRSEFDCTQERYRYFYTSLHSEPMAGGKITATDQATEPWLEIPPRTPAETILKIVCAK